ncbi:MAG: PmeII family type II restriction endonuclease [Bacteroidales bacterium]|nr:cytosolic protein [Bacteroidales bacterium]MBS3776989.1 cytosolic protein [Bacteroidales bacterium]
MRNITLADVRQYVEDNIGTFHEKRLESLNNLKLKQILRKKNPYLFRTKHLQTSEAIVRKLADAHISSSEETILGDWLEGLAIFINEQEFGGWKSGIRGIDLEFNKNNTRYIVTIKSGPNWGNSTQIAKMKDDFITAKRTLRTSNSQLNIVAINGCCYGRLRNPDRGDHFKYCGQDFWEFISGDSNLYKDIIEPLGHRAKEHNEDFIDSYSKVINKFTKAFSDDFCLPDGSIDWEKLVAFNSGRK